MEFFFFFSHLFRSLADGWSRRGLHEEPAYLLPVESSHPVNPRADLCRVSRSWNSQPLKQTLNSESKENPCLLAAPEHHFLNPGRSDSLHLSPT